MKIQMDTVAKTIKLESNVKLDTLVKTLKKLLPNDEWKQFTLETNTVINNWTSPVIIKEYPAYPRRTWWEQPWYVSSGSMDLSIGQSNISEFMKADYQLKSGTFNIGI